MNDLFFKVFFSVICAHSSTLETELRDRQPDGRLLDKVSALYKNMPKTRGGFAGVVVRSDTCSLKDAKRIVEHFMFDPIYFTETTYGRQLTEHGKALLFDGGKK